MLKEGAGVEGIGKDSLEIGIVRMGGEFELERFVRVLLKGRGGGFLACLTGLRRRRKVRPDWPFGGGVEWRLVRRNHTKALTVGSGQSKDELGSATWIAPWAVG